MADKKRKRTKFVPKIVVSSDDLVVIDEDAPEDAPQEEREYYPHYGETVTFRKSVPLKVMRTLSTVAHVQSLDPTQDPEAFGDAAEALVSVLATQIIDWTWTDHDGEPMPRPRQKTDFVEALWTLETYELVWLQQHMADGAKVPNRPSTPS